MRMLCHIRGFIIAIVLFVSSLEFASAGQSMVHNASSDEAVAAQFSEGTTLPLVVRVLNRPNQPRRDDSTPQDLEEVKRMAREAAAAHSLPVDYFLRLIKQESGFNHRAVSRAGAQGIAQFMPRTAASRGLKNPFDPAEALPKSAAFLSDLTRQFGNIGLAAAAYNGGPMRVANWLAGRGGLPMETRSYVLAVTGRTAEEWAPPGAKLPKSDMGLASLRTETTRRAAAYMPKNWELELLESLTKHPPAGSTGKSLSGLYPLSPRSGARSGRPITRISTTLAERALCPSCLIQSSY